MPTVTLNEVRSEQIRREMVRRAATTSFGAFCTHTDSAFVMYRHTKKIVELLDALAKRDIDRLMIFMPPQNGKPVTIEAMILLGDGSYKRLGDIVVGDVVISHTGKPRRVEAVFEQPAQPGVRIVTQSGRGTEAALDHPFLTPSGWVLAGSLEVGMSLGNLAKPETTPYIDRRIEDYRLAGYFVGDGCCAATGTTIAANVTNIDPGVIADLEVCAAALGFATVRKKMSTFFSDGIRDWLREAGLAKKTSHTKRVPEWVFTSSPAAIAAFLGAYFDCDGTIGVRGGLSRSGGLRTDVIAEIYSVSRDLLVDAQRLFLRLGIQTRLRVKPSTYKGEPYTSYRLAINDMDGVARFTELVPLHSAKATRRASYVRTKFEQPILADPVVEIAPIESLGCRCLTVEVDHTFTADDFIVHNSYLCSERFPAYVMGSCDYTKAMTISYNWKLATQFSRTARELVSSERWPFPARVITAHSAVDSWGLTNGSEMLAAGFGGQVAGSGATLLAVDDPVKNIEEADSEVYRNKTWDFYGTVVRTRIRRNARQLIVSTRWNEDDLCGRLLNSAEADRWTVLTLPAIAEDNDQLGRAIGEPLWPEGPPIPKPSDGVISLRNYSALYQQKPVPIEGNKFKVAWFARRYTTLPPMKRACMFVDGAWKEEIQNSRSGIELWGTTGSEYYLIDIWAGRVEYPDLKRAVRDFYNKWRRVAPTFHLAVEDAASGTGLVQELRRPPSRKGEPEALPVVGVKVDKAKEVRAEAVTPLFEAMLCLFPENAPWLMDVISEHCRFPATPNDLVDCTSGALTKLSTARALWATGMDEAATG